MSTEAAPITISVQPLSPDLLDDYLGFFDRDAFADFPWWSSNGFALYKEMDGWAVVRKAIGEDPMADVREDGW